MTWEESKNFCEERRAALIALETEAKFLFIKDLMVTETNAESDRAWLNSRTETPLIFIWPNNQIISKSFFDGSNPDNNNGKEFCIEFLKFDKLKLNDNDCSFKNNLICEYHD